MSDKKQQDTSEGSIGQSASTAGLGAKVSPQQHGAMDCVREEETKGRRDGVGILVQL